MPMPDDWFVVGFPLVSAAALVVDAPSGRAHKYDDLGAYCETMLVTGALAGGLKLVTELQT